MNRPDVDRSTWGRVILWTVCAAVVSAAAVWLLMPRTPDAFATADQALRAGPGAPKPTTTPSVFTYFGSASSAPAPAQNTPVPAPTSPLPQPGTQIPGLTTPGPALGSSSPAQPTPSGAKASKTPTSPGHSRRASHPPAVALRASRSLASPTALPVAVIGSDVAKASGYSPTVAVKFGQGNSFAVAPVADAAGRSALPALLAAALVAALASLGGAAFGQRRNRGTAGPAVVTGLPAGAGLRASSPPGTEPVTTRELARLRRDAQQKTTLARSVAELLPSMPEALVWQAEKALAEAGVRQIVPDGEPFDAAVHHAVGTEPVPRGAQENTIARTIRPGYADGQRMLVYPRVVVYADDSAGRTR